jgi:ribonuclease HI
VEIYSDSRLVVEQINGMSQCLDGVLNEYRRTCMELMGKFRRYDVKHVRWEDNERANNASWCSRRLGTMLDVASFR